MSWHGAQVQYSLDTTVNTPLFQAPMLEFGHGAGTQVLGLICFMWMEGLTGDKNEGGLIQQSGRKHKQTNKHTLKSVTFGINNNSNVTVAVI